MIHIILIGISQEAANASKSDILLLAAKQQCHVEVAAIADSDDLPMYLPQCNILAIEDKVMDTEGSRIFAMLRSSVSPECQDFAVIVYSSPIGEPCFKKWLESLPPKGIAIPLLRGRKTELVNSIAYFENKSRKVFVKTDESHYPTTLCMKQTEELVAAFPFLSPYVGYLVNLGWVEQISSRDIILKNGEILPLSQKRASAFRKAYRDFCKS